VRSLLARRRDKPRRYLRPGLALDDFFAELERIGVRYAVLRWFDTLPAVAAGEDVDLLVADEDLPRLRPYLRSYYAAPGTQAFDVYSASGLPGSDFLGVPYYPEGLASGLLDRSVLLRGRFRVPDERDHFDSLAYHAVYHKGHASGLPENAASEPSAPGADHDYAAVLAELADRLSLPVSITLEGLDTYLTDNGLRPPLDTLDKLSAANPWLAARVDKLWGPPDGGVPGLSVFVLRERAAHLLDRLNRELLREGFQPLETVHLDTEAAARVAAGVRGGNWGQGPWPVGGGGPVTYVVAYDLTQSLGEADSPTDPARVQDAKIAIRDRLLAALPEGELRFNPLHSSDDPRQALDHLALLGDSGIVARVRRRIAEIHDSMRFPYPVVQLLPSLQRRAVTAIVRHPDHGECVCKLFYPSSGRFLARELRARTELADLPETPGLLEAGPNYLLTPRYSDTGAHVRRGLPRLRHVQLTPAASAALARLARDLHERNAFLLDLSTQNLMSDPEAGLKVIDWEFLQDFEGTRPPLRRSPTLRGRPHGPSEADLPVGATSAEGRGTAFRPLFTGVPTSVLLRAPLPLLAPVAEIGMVVLYGLRSVRLAGRLGRAALRRNVKRTGRVVLDRVAHGGART
jgi:hypothetical protein